MGRRRLNQQFGHVRFISAGAGSGKTYRLTEELERSLVDDGLSPSRVIGTTFTVKAAAELRERVRERLIQSGRAALAEHAAQALIGTVHSVCERLLKRFAFELGLSPNLHVASLEDCSALFSQAVDRALSATTVRQMNGIASQLGVEDWRNDVKRIVDRARDNDITPSALAAMGRDSADALLAFLPAPQEGDWDRELLAAVSAALKEIDLTVDTTVGTAKYVKKLRSYAYQLRRPPCEWDVWISLSGEKATKKSESSAARVRAAAAVYDRHPRFQRDVRAYIENVFEIAGETLERFQGIKTERGLIDFSDMEQLTLRALDDSAVRERLGRELDLLLVDEFQDTNPMQLAIFMKLAELARSVVFVGDVKQAIYAFRGCDPDLVFATLAALAKAGSNADVLPHSWRSRPPLVQYVNSIFCQAFANEIPAGQVSLSPKRQERTDEPAVLRWHLAGRKDEERAAALAQGIADLVQSGYRVVDPDTGQVRPARWGDVAVLATTNNHVEQIARALRTARVPMKMTLQGLLTVPEVCLAKACLRRLNDATDTLATAEIIAMTDCTEPETWLADRLQWVMDESRDAYAWAETNHPVITALKALREEIGTQSPVEVVARVLNYVGIREVVTAWGPNAIKAMQRQRNLDALLNLAVEYEHHSEAQHQAATLTGFLFWLEHPHSPELDLQPVVTTGDAVHVLTYHRAKGLEWPIVVNTDFHYTWQTRLWDVRVERRGGSFDILAPLADRTIRFWPRMFGGRTSAAFIDAIIDSPVGLAVQTQCDSEGRRLAYVGLTRARDCVVLAIPDKGPGDEAWIRSFAGDFLLPNGEEHVLADGSRIGARSLVVGGAAASPITPAAFAPRRLPARAPRTDIDRERVNPSAAPALAVAVADDIVELGDRIAVYGGDMTRIGAALHALIAAELLNPARPDAEHHAHALLAGYGVGDLIDAQAALGAAQRFRAWVQQRFTPRRTFVEHPIMHRLDDGRVVSGWIDVLLDTPTGWVVIDHKSSPRPRREWRKETLAHSGQMAMYCAALRATGKTVTQSWIHFPVGGHATVIIE